MAYTPIEINTFHEQRKKLERFIQEREQQEQIWKNKEHVFVPTTVNFSDIDDRTQLDYAAMLGDFESVKDLLSKGAKSSNTLKYALKGGYPKIVQFLMENGFEYSLCAGFHQADNSCRQLIIDDVKKRFQSDLESLIASEDLYERPSLSGAGHSLLHYGALLPFSEFKALIKDVPKDKINWERSVNENSIEKATPLAYAIMENNVDYFEYLLDLNPDLNEPCLETYPPLLLAAVMGNIKIVSRLKEKGVNFEYYDPRTGSNPLHLAIKSGVPEVVAFMLENSKDISMQDYYGKNIVHYLANCKNEDTIKMILQHPLAKDLIHQKDYFGRTPFDLAQLKHNDLMMKHLSAPSNIPLASPVTINQANVINNLVYFLKATNAGDPASMPLDGHCNAFSFLYLYYYEQGLKDEFFDMLKFISGWNGDLEYLNKNEPVASFSGSYKNGSDLFLQWANDLIWFMQGYIPDELKKVNPTQHSRKEQLEIVQKENALFPVNLKELTGNINRDQLAEYLTLFSSVPGLSVEITGGLHATSFRVLEDQTIDYYDPNAPYEIKPFSSPQTTANHVLDTKFRMLGQLMNDDYMEIEFRFDNTNLKPQHTENTQWDPQSYLKAYEQSPNHFTPLHKAILLNDGDAVKELVEMDGIDLTLKDYLNRTALNFAAHLNSDEIIIDICHKVSTQNTPDSEILNILFKNKNYSLIKTLVENFSFKQATILVNTLIDMLDVAKRDDNQTLYQELLSLFDTILENDIDPNAQAQRNPDVFYKFKYFDHPLENAIETEQTDLIERLIKHGATLPESSISSLLQKPSIAKYLIDNYPKQIQFLCTKMPDPYFEPEILAYLIEKKLITVQHMEKEQVLSKASQEQDSAKLQFLINQKLDLNQIDEAGRTPLISALKGGPYSMPAIDNAKMLIQAGADVLIADNANALPLHYALSTRFYDDNLVKLLIPKSAARINQQTAGMTPLHIAVLRDKLEGVRMLLKQGADPHIKNLQSKSAIELAEESHPEIFELIQKLVKEHNKAEPRKESIVSYKHLTDSRVDAKHPQQEVENIVPNVNASNKKPIS